MHAIKTYVNTSLPILAFFGGPQTADVCLFDSTSNISSIHVHAIKTEVHTWTDVRFRVDRLLRSQWPMPYKGQSRSLSCVLIGPSNPVPNRDAEVSTQLCTQLSCRSKFESLCRSGDRSEYGTMQHLYSRSKHWVDALIGRQKRVRFLSNTLRLDITQQTIYRPKTRSGYICLYLSTSVPAIWLHLHI